LSVDLLLIDRDAPASSLRMDRCQVLAADAPGPVASPSHHTGTGASER